MTLEEIAGTEPVFASRHTGFPVTYSCDDVVNYASLVGDTNPLHDQNGAKSLGFSCLVPGLLLLHDALTSQKTRLTDRTVLQADFCAPVFGGDTVRYETKDGGVIEANSDKSNKPHLTTSFLTQPLSRSVHGVCIGSVGGEKLAKVQKYLGNRAQQFGDGSQADPVLTHELSVLSLASQALIGYTKSIRSGFTYRHEITTVLGNESLQAIELFAERATGLREFAVDEQVSNDDFFPAYRRLQLLSGPPLTIAQSVSYVMTNFFRPSNNKYAIEVACLDNATRTAQQYLRLDIAMVSPSMIQRMRS